jgi:hypothetical protein
VSDRPRASDYVECYRIAAYEATATRCRNMPCAFMVGHHTLLRSHASQNRQNRMPSCRERGIPKMGPRKRKVPMSDLSSHSQILGLQTINHKTSEPDFSLQMQAPAASRHNG